MNTLLTIVFLALPAVLHASTHDYFFGILDLPDGFAIPSSGIQRGPAKRVVQNDQGFPNIHFRIGGGDTEDIPTDTSTYGYFKTGTFSNGVRYFATAPADKTWVYFAIPDSGPARFWATVKSDKEIQAVVSFLRTHYSPRRPPAE